MTIAIIGCGYVGLVTGACLAGMGHDVVCVDRDRARAAMIGAGLCPIHEPGLARLLADNVLAGRLRASHDIAAAAAADLVFIAVGTPPLPDTGAADLADLEAAVRAVAAVVPDRAVLAVKSTVPIGTGDRLQAIVDTQEPRRAIAVLSNPEFLREGSGVDDFRHPDRIVIGGGDGSAMARLETLHRPLCFDGTPVLKVSRASAETIKYAANGFLAMKVAFINEIADLSERTGADIADVARGIGLDPRIGARFLAPGPGFGGSCFPKDVLALSAAARAHGTPLRLMDATLSANLARAEAMADKIAAACGGSVMGATIALLGLAFKAGTDDVRQSPALAVAAALLARGAVVRAYDPLAMAGAAAALPALILCADAHGTAQGSEALVIATEWQDFADLDLVRLRASMRHPRLVDLRNLYDPAAARRAGFGYWGVGRPDAPLGEAEAAQRAG